MLSMWDVLILSIPDIFQATLSLKVIFIFNLEEKFTLNLKLKLDSNSPWPDPFLKYLKSYISYDEM